MPAKQWNDWQDIMVVSAWGFALVIASFSFSWIGYRLDKYFETPPMFMLGLLLLAVVTCIGKMYQEAWIKRNKV